MLEQKAGDLPLFSRFQALKPKALRGALWKTLPVIVFGFKRAVFFRRPHAVVGIGNKVQIGVF